MPRYWHDRHSVMNIEDDAERTYQRSIVADKKPYFMIYIYPDLKKQYNTYIKNANKNAMREFCEDIDTLQSKPYNDLTDKQKDFLAAYKQRMPVGMSDCVMNKICRKFEDKFSGFVSASVANEKFDYSIYKSGCDYSKSKFYSIQDLYNDYNNKLKDYAVFSYYERPDEDDSSSALRDMKAEFMRQCYEVCQNEYELCDIIIDICYRRSSTKKFAWDMCCDTIINNLLTKNKNIISFMAEDESGDVEYCGERFSVRSISLEDSV